MTQNNRQKMTEKKTLLDALINKGKNNKIIVFIMIVFLVISAIDQFINNGFVISSWNSITSFISKNAGNETLGASLLRNSKERNPGNFTDEKSNKFNKGNAIKVVNRLDKNDARIELEALKENKLELAIIYLEKEIKSSNDEQLLIDLFIELATLEYLNNNLQEALNLYEALIEDLILTSDTNFSEAQISEIYYQIERLKELLNKENLNSGIQIEYNTLNNNGINTQPNQTNDTDTSEGIGVLQNINPQNKQLRTNEWAPVVLLSDDAIVSTTQPSFGSVMNNHENIIVYTPIKNYCNSINGEKDTFTYTTIDGSKVNVHVTVICIKR